MGIRYLNRYLLDKCNPTSIRKISFAEMRHQTIIIDTSIYMYKFVEKGDFLENMYLFISIFREYGIIPIFIFDGKPPVEKKDLLARRKQEKKDAETRYNEIKYAVEMGTSEQDILKDLEEMEELKKKFVRINSQTISDAKQLMQYYGVNYVESRGEADQLCAYLTKHHYAWGCMSDDMDMFLYGCPRVIRHVSLLNHTAVVYDTAKILRDLNLTFPMFKDILVLSGTDYNIHDKMTLQQTLAHYSTYINIVHPLPSPSNDWNATVHSRPFYDWLCVNTDYITDREKLDKVHSMFDLNVYAASNMEEIKEVIANAPFKNNLIQMGKLRKFMEKDGFIFSLMSSI